MAKLCIISHSGGLDSSTLMAKALAEGMVVQPITFNYGQTNSIESIAQGRVWEIYKKRYNDNLRKTIELNVGELLGSIKHQYQLIRDSGKVEDKTELEFYTPFRNLVFSSLAAMVGEIICITEDIDELYVGIGVHKHSSDSYKKDYWDITPAFVEKLNEVLKLNDGIQCQVFAPYANDFKEVIVRDAVELDVPYLQTWTCYDPVYSEMLNDKITVSPCRKCESCIERDLQGQKAGVDDINEYYVELKVPASITVVCNEIDGMEPEEFNINKKG